MRSLGIDVGVRKGLDLVVMDETRSFLQSHRRVEVEALGPMIGEIGPDVIAVDAPPRWATHPGGSRLTEREIRRFGIQSFGTPSAERHGDKPFYEWMKVGFRVFAAAEERGFRPYGAGPVRGKAIEVFPHATAVVLAGCLPPRSAGKREWRMGVLRKQGVTVDGLRSADQVDAALAALTGVLAHRGRFFAPGDPKEGVIVLPATAIPARPYRVCREARAPAAEIPLPGFAPCACGDPDCARMTSREFAPGHDAKRKSALWKLAREGQEAIDELKERRWELPSEMR